ncbi:hypothetical protein AYI70_g11649 [Smittium culicis]|uniref:Uncharacterized protein n=1 Tax=Smittium culicis TaxID=133412 RepID=A0A1R1X114_9FUNG|nr:hypothetical protein AYI70_g11649 [Smittium culicis]
MSTDLDLDSQAILHGLVYLDRHNQLPPEGLDYINSNDEKRSNSNVDSKGNSSAQSEVLDSNKKPNIPENKPNSSKQSSNSASEKALKSDMGLDSSETQHAIATLKIETSAVMKELARFRACDDETISCFYCREWAQWVYRKQVVITNGSTNNSSSSGGGKRKKKGNASRHDQSISTNKEESDDRELKRAMRDKLKSVKELCNSLRQLVSNVEISEKKSDSSFNVENEIIPSQSSSPLIGSSEKNLSEVNFFEKAKSINPNLSGDSLIESIVENVEKWIGGYKFPLADAYKDLVFEFPTDAFPYEEHQDPLDPALLLPTLHVTKTYISLSSSDFALLGNITSELIATHTYPTCQHNKAEHPTPSELETQRVIFNSQLAKYRKEYVSNYEREMDPVWQITQLLLKSIQRIEAMRVRLFTRGCHTNMQQFIQSIYDKTLPFTEFWSKSTANFNRSTKATQETVDELDSFFYTHLKNVSDVSSSWSKTFLESYYGVAREFVRELETILGECITMCDRRALGLKYPPPLTLEPQLEVARRTISQLQPSLCNRIDKIQSMLKVRSTLVNDEIEEVRKMWSFDPNLPFNKAVSVRLDRAAQKDLRKKMKRIEFLQHSGVISWSMQEMEQLLASSDVAKVAVDCLELLITEAEILERAVGQVFARKLESTTEELREQRQDIMDDFTEGLLTGREELAGIIGKLLLKEAWRILEANISLQRQHDLLGGRSKKGKSGGNRNSDSRISNKAFNSEHSTKIKLLASGLTQSHDLINNLDGVITSDKIAEISVTGESFPHENSQESRKKSKNKKKKKKSKSRAKSSSSLADSATVENNSADERNDDLAASDNETSNVNDSYFMPLASNFNEDESIEPTETEKIELDETQNSKRKLSDNEDPNIEKETHQLSTNSIIDEDSLTQDQSTKQPQDSPTQSLPMSTDSDIALQSNVKQNSSSLNTDTLPIHSPVDPLLNSVDIRSDNNPELPQLAEGEDADEVLESTEIISQPSVSTRPGTPGIDDVKIMSHSDLIDLATHLLQQKKMIQENLLSLKSQSNKLSTDYKNISLEVAEVFINSQTRQAESLVISEAMIMMEKEAMKWKLAYEDLYSKFSSSEPLVKDSASTLDSSIKSDERSFIDTLKLMNQKPTNFLDNALSESLENSKLSNSSFIPHNPIPDSSHKTTSSSNTDPSALHQPKKTGLQDSGLEKNSQNLGFNKDMNGSIATPSNGQFETINSELLAQSFPNTQHSTKDNFNSTINSAFIQNPQLDSKNNRVTQSEIISKNENALFNNSNSSTPDAGKVQAINDGFNKNAFDIKDSQLETFADHQQNQNKHHEALHQQQQQQQQQHHQQQQIVNYPFPLNWNPFYQNSPSLSSNMMMYPQYSQHNQIPFLQPGLNSINRGLMGLQNDQNFINRSQNFIHGNSSNVLENNSGAFSNVPMNIAQQYQQNGSIDPLLPLQLQMQMQMNLGLDSNSTNLKQNSLLNLNGNAASLNMNATSNPSRNNFNIDGDDRSTPIGANIPQSALSN